MVKGVVSLVLAMVLLTSVAACSRGEKLAADQANMPASSKDFEGEQYQDVVDVLHDAGFTNVETKPLGDLLTGWLHGDGETKDVEIGGVASFDEGDTVQRDVEIRLSYHSFPKDKEVPTKSAPPATATTAPTVSFPPTATPDPWAGPTDGTWSQGDIGFENLYKGLYSEWQVRVQGLPQFSPLRADGQVTVTGTFLVERIEDHGNGETVSGDNSFFFSPGNLSHPYDESYGTYTTVKCDRERIAIGENATCRISFTAPTAEMPNFYWSADGQMFAAWPGQIPS